MMTNDIEIVLVGGQTDQNPMIFGYFCSSSHFSPSQDSRTVSKLQNRCFWQNSKIFSDLLAKVSIKENLNARNCQEKTKMKRHNHGRRKDFFQGRPPGDFSRGVKSGEIWFFPLESKKTTFFAEDFKIEGAPPGELCLPLPTPMVATKTPIPCKSVGQARSKNI